MTTQIHLIAGSPGSGKTKLMIETILNRPDKYLFAMPRNELIETVALKLPLATAIHSDNSDLGVGDRLTQFLDDNATASTACALISHAALLDADLTHDRIADWHLILDEVPASAVIADVLYAPLSLSAVQGLFELIPDGVGIMRLKARHKNSAMVRRVHSDPQMEKLATLYKRARRGLVFVQIPSAPAKGPLNDTAVIERNAWADVEAKPCPYVSLFSLREFSGFKSVTVSAAGLTRSLVHLCDKQTYNVVARPETPKGGRVVIHYFDNAVQATSTLFQSDLGKASLSKIALHLKSINFGAPLLPNHPRYDPEFAGEPTGYFSCNRREVEEHLRPLMPGFHVGPMQEGANHLRRMTDCAIFLSAKNQPRKDAMLRRVYGIEGDQIRVAREDELIYQFCFRGRPRMDDFNEGETYNLYVYDLWQAQRLQAHMIAAGIADVSTLHIDLSLGLKLRKRAGPKAKLTTVQKAANKVASDARYYAAKVAATKAAQAGLGA